MDANDARFLRELLAAIAECRKIGYNPSRFAQMIGASPFQAVRSLLASPGTSEGFATLFEKDHLHLSVEAIVLKPEWRGFFSAQEIETARSRLADVFFRAPWDDGDPPPPEARPEIDQLLAQLTAARGNMVEGKRIRSRLRTLGYYGGLRARANDLQRGLHRSAPAHAHSINPASPIPQLKPDFILPPIKEAESLLSLVRSLVGAAERNHENAVRDLLIRLGFDVTSVRFQRGHIDVCVLDQKHAPVAVFEVKRTIASESERVGARRQAMDYAGESGVVIVVVTDGDRYEIYDRRRGHNYDAMFCGKFQLTAFREHDAAVLDLLRPRSLLGNP